MKAKKILYIVLIVLAVVAAIAGTAYIIDNLLRKKLLKRNIFLAR